MEPPGFHRYWKSAYVQDLSAGVIDAMIEGAATMTSPLSHLHVMQLGGAISRGGEEDTAFSHRETPYECYIVDNWTNPEEAERHLVWARDTWSALQAFSPGTGYLNRNSDEEDQARLSTTYGARKYERLVALEHIRPHEPLPPEPQHQADRVKGGRSGVWWDPSHLPRRTTQWSRHPTASAALRLSGAAHRQR